MRLIGFRDHLNLLWPHLNLILSAKTLFLYNITFTGFLGRYKFLQDIIQPSISGEQKHF